MDNSELSRALNGGMTIDQMQRDLATRNEDIGRLQGELGKAMARIAELEAAQNECWMQLNADEEHIQEDKTILFENQGQWVGIKRGDAVFGVWLNEMGCAVFRKIQPAA